MKEVGWGGGGGLREGRVGLLGKWLWRGARQLGPGLEKGKSVCLFLHFRLCEDHHQSLDPEIMELLYKRHKNGTAA